jgi:hypothetical protein
MAAANESQGLKIAVAVFVTLSVILAVTTYFGFRSASELDVKLTLAESKRTQADKVASDALSQYNDLRKAIGSNVEDIEAFKAEMKKEHAKIDEKIKSTVDSVQEAVAKAQAAGAQGAELQETKDTVQRLAAAYRSDPNKTYISALDRESDLLKNLSLLSARMAINYVDVKRSLESANQINDTKMQELVKAVEDAKKDLTGEHEKHEGERQGLLTRLDKFQTENQTLQATVANLQAKLRETEDEGSKKLALAQQTLRDQRDQLEKEANVLDVPDGYITYVDYNRGEVQCNVTRPMGARPQMVFTIFDRNAPGVPTDKPKGTIELIEVNDRFSIGRIIKTLSSIEPFREGDIVYSPAWSPNEPMRFALIGKIDINRDSKDDREDLKRMIRAAGGIVDYDLPPPEAGRESGKLTGRDAWYVVDDPKVRPPFRDLYGKTGVTELETTEFLKKQSEAVREARLNGVRPMPLGRLLPFLGYTFGAPVVGRAEALDVKTLKQMTSPRQGGQKAKAATAAEAAPAEKPEEPAKEKEEMPKEEK